MNNHANEGQVLGIFLYQIIFIFLFEPLFHHIYAIYRYLATIIIYLLNISAHNTAFRYK